MSPAATDGVVVGYLVSLAVWIPASGWVGDRFGTKRTFMVAISLFTFASALCGLSQSVLELVLFRVLQGAGGGMLTPVGMAMLYRAYPPAQRARAGADPRDPDGDGTCPRAAHRWRAGRQPLVAVGVLRERADRARSTHLQPLKLKEHRERAGERFDVPGFVLAAAGFGLFLYALSEAATLGWTAPVIDVTALVGAALDRARWSGWSCMPSSR